MPTYMALFDWFTLCVHCDINANVKTMYLKIISKLWAQSHAVLNYLNISSNAVWIFLISQLLGDNILCASGCLCVFVAIMCSCSQFSAVIPTVLAGTRLRKPRTHSLTYTHMKEQMGEIDTWDCYRNCLLKVSTEMCACLTIPLEWHLNQNNKLGSLSVAFYFSVWFFLSSSLFHLLSFAVPSHTLLALLPRVMGGEIGVTVGICSPALHDGTQKHTSAETHTSTGALNASGAATDCVQYQGFRKE